MNIIGSIKNIANRTADADYIVIKGEQKGKIEGYTNLKEAKLASKTFQGDEVLMLDKKSGKVKVYDAVTAKNTFINSQLAETPFKKVIKNDPSINVNYQATKLNFDLKLDLTKPDLDDTEKALDIVDEKGLSLTGDDITSEIARGSKAFRMVLDKELGRGNFSEAKEVYNSLENINKNSNDLDIVKIARKTNLSKMFRSGPELRPFVEEQMTKYKYSEADKKAVRAN